MATKQPKNRRAASPTVARDRARHKVRQALGRAVRRERSIVRLAKQLSRETRKADEALDEIVNSVQAAHDVTREFFKPLDQPAAAATTN